MGLLGDILRLTAAGGHVAPLTVVYFCTPEPRLKATHIILVYSTGCELVGWIPWEEV